MNIMLKRLFVLWVCLLLCITGCSINDTEVLPRELSEAEQEMLLQAKMSVHSYFLGCYYEDEGCDYKSGSGYVLSDPIRIYDISTENGFHFTEREGQYIFVGMKNDHALFYRYHYDDGGRIQNYNVEVWESVLNEKQNFVFVADGEGSWIVTEQDSILFEYSDANALPELSEDTLKQVRNKLLKKQQYSFIMHDVIYDEMVTEEERLIHEAQEAERNFQFPEGICLFGDLILEDAGETSLHIDSMEGRISVYFSDENKKIEFLESLGNISLSTEYEIQHGAGGEIVTLEIHYGNGWNIQYIERTDDGTLTATKGDKKMSYVAVDEQLREQSIFSSVFQTMIEGTEMTLRNENHIVTLMPQRVERDGYFVTSELSVYSYPYSTLEDIDFSEYELYCDGKKVEELSTEPGEHLLEIIVDDSTYYHIKYFCD